MVENRSGDSEGCRKVNRRSAPSRKASTAPNSSESGGFKLH